MAPVSATPASRAQQAAPFRFTRYFARRTRAAVAGAIVMTLFVLSACADGTGPGRSGPASLRVELPEFAGEGQPFPLEVTALGRDGTALSGFSGTVQLTVSSGSIAPQTMQLTGGTGAVEATITGATGEVTVRATMAALVHTTAIRILGPEQQLEGAPTDPAETAIPERKFIARIQDYSPDHPALSGAMISFNTIVLVLKLGTTVGQANALLGTLDAEIVGGIPGVAGQASGILYLRLKTTTHQQLEATLASLRQNSAVHSVVQDALGALGVVPGQNVGGPPAMDWSWDMAPFGANWGMELIRAPQMWNLNTRINARTVTGVLDGGFATHPDLNYHVNVPAPGVTISPDNRDHGTHVAGIIGALFNNGVGVDGLTPFAQLVVSPVVPPVGALALLQNLTSFGAADYTLYDLIRHASRPRVINISMGHDWGAANPATNAALRALSTASGLNVIALLNILSIQGHQIPLIVAAAGNDHGQPAVWGGPWNNAALMHNQADIIVVESIANAPGQAGGATLSSFSNVDGHVSAPGGEFLPAGMIWSTAESAPYLPKSGTSMAAPHVTGLASYLLSVDPTLTNAQLRDLLLNPNNTVAVAGGASPRIDAFASVMDIDRVKGGTRVLRMLVDIDDGTEDGNRRTSPDASFADYEADADPDGRIDMSDFRRWRDGWLLISSAEADLDGSSTHPKKDLNRNGEVDDQFDELKYPFVDLNGDGDLDLLGFAFVTGALGRNVTDLQVLQELFDDPHYAKADLDGLVESADIAIRPARLLVAGEAVDIHSSVRPAGTAAAADDAKFRRIHTGNEADGQALWQVYTVPVVDAGYTARIVGIDAEGDTIFDEEKDFSVKPGQDHFWDPVPVKVEITPEQVTLGFGGTQPFTATVAGTADNGVDWSAAGGTIDASGLYTAGQALGSFKVRATSHADPGVWAEATVTIDGPIRVLVGPESASLGSTDTLRFNATVTGTSEGAVIWSTSDFVPHGVIDPNGLYTAPLLGPRESAEDYVVATSVADPAASDTTHIVISEPPQPGCEVPPCGGSSYGDPHLITPDGLHYDFMAIGDFILVKSTDPAGRLEIQTRYRRPDQADEYSWNQAVAMRVGDDVVNVYAGTRGRTELMINGADVPVDTRLLRRLDGGGTVLVSSDTVRVSWPDGTMVRMLPAFWENNVLAAVHVFLPASRNGAVEGLFGNFDGDPRNDIRIRGGEVLEDPKSDRLYLDFRQSWRVASGSSQSLFFRAFDNWDPFFPPDVVGFDDLDAAAVARAETVCRAAGVVDVRVFDACVFDVALTGDDEWALIAAGVDPARPSVTVVPGLAYVTGGATQDFSAIVTGPGSHQVLWTATGGTIVPVSDTRMTYTAPGGTGEHTVTGALVGHAGVTGTATVHVTGLNVPPGYTAAWTGARSIDWGHGGNWVAGTPPGPTDNVFIPASAARHPVLARNDSTVRSSSLAIRDLLVETGARVTLSGATQTASAFQLSVSGNVNAAGNVEGAGTLILTGSGRTVQGNFSNVTVQGTVALAGTTVVGGKFQGLTGSLTPGGHTLTIEGDALFSSIVVRMQDAADLVIIKGKATFGAADRRGTLTAGELHLAGDFEAQDAGTSQNPIVGFPSTTKVVLNGTAPQTVTFRPKLNGGVDSHFHDLEIVNPTTVTFAPVNLNRNGVPVRGDLRVNAPATLDGGGAISVSGDLTSITGSNITVALIRLGGPLGTTGVEGDFSPGAVQFIGTTEQPLQPNLAYRNVEVTATVRLIGPTSVSGYVKVGSDNGRQGPLDFNGQTLTVEGDFLTESGVGLRMVNAADRLIVKGRMNLQGGDTRGQLTDGAVQLAGDFYAGMWNFSSSGTKMILNGTTTQKLEITTNFTGATRSYFHDLEITNPVGVDVVASNSLVLVNQHLELKGVMTVLAGARMQVTGTLFLRSSARLVNNGTLQVNGCVKDAGHTIEGTDPCPVIASQPNR